MLIPASVTDEQLRVTDAFVAKPHRYVTEDHATKVVQKRVRVA
jgi:hypothetical protein